MNVRYDIRYSRSTEEQDQPINIVSETNTSALVGRVNDAEFGHVAREAAAVIRLPGRRSVLRNDIYVHTNFYIN